MKSVSCTKTSWTYLDNCVVYAGCLLKQHICLQLVLERVGPLQNRLGYIQFASGLGDKKNWMSCYVACSSSEKVCFSSAARSRWVIHLIAKLTRYGFMVLTSAKTPCTLHRNLWSTQCYPEAIWWDIYVGKDVYVAWSFLLLQKVWEIWSVRATNITWTQRNKGKNRLVKQTDVCAGMSFHWW